MKSTSPRKSFASSLECLEARIAPASLISPKLLTYTDADGNLVSVSCSKAALAMPNFVFVNSGLGQQLETFNVPKAAAGAKISISGVPSHGHGDGLVNVGSILAPNIDLGAVTVKGDLGQIVAGDSVTGTLGLASLSVHSLGALGGSTEAGTTPSVVSNVTGGVGSLTVSGDVHGGFRVTGKKSPSDGNIQRVIVDGSLLGGAAPNTGEISASGTIGSLIVKGSIVGGAKANTGMIFAGLGAGMISVGGSMIGGESSNSGEIAIGSAASAVSVKSIHVGHDLVTGGSGTTGVIEVFGNVSTGISVGGSMNGGSFNKTGAIIVSGNVTSIAVGGDISGGNGKSASSVSQTGYIGAAHIGSVKVGGSIYAGQNVSTIGITLTASGAIEAANDIGSVVIAGNVVGSGNTDAVISARGLAVVSSRTKVDVAIGRISIGGSISSTNIEAGYNLSGVAVNGDASIGAITIGGDVVASNIAAGVDSGSDGILGTVDDAVVAAGIGTTNVPRLIARIASIKIAGQVLGTPTAASATDSYAIETQAIGSFSAGGVAIPLTAGGTVTLSNTTGGDVKVREFPTP